MLPVTMNRVVGLLEDAICGSRPVFVAAPLIRWQAELFQRPQHIARALADLGALVLFFEPPSPHPPKHVIQVTNSLYVLPELAFSKIIEDYSGLWVDIYSTSAMPGERVDWLRRHGHRLIYEYVDEIDSSISIKAAKCMELFRMFSVSPPDLTIVTAAKLRKDVDAAWPNGAEVILSPNAADPSHFERALRFPRETPLTKSLRERAKGRPIIGYYGALADWIDYEAIHTLANISPDLFFCYIGPKYRPSIKLPTAENIAWPGPVDYKYLPDIASIFDVATIPFRSGEVAKATSPLKLYEYFSLCLPVVVNKDMFECLQFDYVTGADTADEWRSCILRAMRLRRKENYEFFCKVTIAQNTWALRAEQVFRVMSRNRPAIQLLPGAASSGTDADKLLELLTTASIGRHRLDMPGNSVEAAVTDLAESLTQGLASVIRAEHLDVRGWKRSEMQADLSRRTKSLQSIFGEHKSQSWQTLKAMNWPAVRPVISARPISMRKIALIADEFTSTLLAYDADVTHLTPENCISILEAQHIDLFLMESVWFGHNKSWSSLWKDAKEGGGLFTRLKEVIENCRRRGVPSVFWNKEDPEHYDLFIPIARLFDQVYTTEVACWHNYCADLGHSRIGTLVFAAQPALQNPFLQTGRLRSGVAFAGSWYKGKHAYRAEQQSNLLTAGMKFGVDIYDRALRDRTGQFSYPEKFQGNIVGTLDFHRICTAYRQYNVFLNVNTVSKSETMCARRVFEITASRTAIVTTPSRAVSQLFGNAIANGEGVDFFIDAIGTYLGDRTKRIRDAHQAYRETHRNHTYRQRLGQIYADVGVAANNDHQEQVIVLVDLADSPDGGGDFLRNMVLLQTQRPTLAVLVGRAASEAVAALQSEGIPVLLHDALPAAIGTIVTAVESLDLRGGRDWVATLHAECSYGTEYLADQMLAGRLGAVRIVAKARGKCQEFKAVDISAADPRALLIDVGQFLSIFGSGASVSSIDQLLLEISRMTGTRDVMLSDIFNFSRDNLDESAVA